MTTHTHGYYEQKESIKKRLNRAEGQVRGIARMVDEDTYCIDVLTQVNAVRAALDKVAIELMRDHTKHCMMNAVTDDERETKAEELASAIGRMLSR